MRPHVEHLPSPGLISLAIRQPIISRDVAGDQLGELIEAVIADDVVALVVDRQS